MKLIFKIEVDAHLSKKNNRPIFKSRGTGKMFIGKNKALTIQENILISEMKKKYREYCKELNKNLSPISGPISCKMLFYLNKYYNKNGSKNKKLPDLSNLYELPQDCLQKAGVIENDSQIESHDGSRRLPGDKNLLIIEISSYNAL